MNNDNDDTDYIQSIIQSFNDLMIGGGSKRRTTALSKSTSKKKKKSNNDSSDDDDDDNDNNNDITTISTRNNQFLITSLHLYRIGYILQKYFNNNNVGTVLSNNDSNTIHPKITTIQESVRDIIESISIEYRQRLVLELYTSLHTLLVQQYSYSNSPKHDADDGPSSIRNQHVQDAIQSMVQIHNCSLLVSQSLQWSIIEPLILIATESDNTDNDDDDDRNNNNNNNNNRNNTSYRNRKDAPPPIPVSLLCYYYEYVTTKNKTKTLLSSTTNSSSSSSSLSFVQSSILQLLYYMLFSTVATSSSSLSSLSKSTAIIDIDKLVVCILTIQNYESTITDALTNEINVWDDFIRYMSDRKFKNSSSTLSYNWTEQVIKYYTDIPNIDTNQVQYLNSLLSVSVSSTNSNNSAIQSVVQSAIAGYRPNKSKSTILTNSSKTSGIPSSNNAAGGGGGIKEVQRRIQQIQEVVGYDTYSITFIEAALAHTNGDVEGAVTMILSENPTTDWPIALQLLTDLGSTTQRYQRQDDNEEEAIAAKEITKANIRAMEEQQKQSAHYVTYAMDIEDNDTEPVTTSNIGTTRNRYKEDNDEYDDVDYYNDDISIPKVDEYDDDYDDQYDDLYFGTIGKQDNALYDDDNDSDNGINNNNNTMNHRGGQRKQSHRPQTKEERDSTYQAIRAYNETVKGVVAESAYWDTLKNTNRQQNDGNGTGEKKYRGPDRGRGGRIIRRDNTTNEKQQNASEETTNSNTTTTSGGRGEGRGQQEGGRGGRGRGGSGRGRDGGGRGNGGGTDNRGGRGGGRSGRIGVTTGRGGGGGENVTSTATDTTTTTNTTTTTTTGNPRAKERRLEKRKEQQKNAMYKRSG